MAIEEFSSLLKRLRTEAKLTQEELGDKVGVTYVAIGDWERGKRKPKRFNVESLARALSANENEMLLAAGFAPGEITRESVIDLSEIEGYDDLDADSRGEMPEEIADAIARLRRRQRKRENIGANIAE